ncbi:hypothetical protein HPB50_022644 [Hyalomma asiaticum]|uniref:Uncharacterized protein n=1 Tax=Hyalomma asiaticum TaxID=266040 RepID=A0ACB7RWH9_HYAAI|nr:hypothetical protein HPB50_022644 [Hyalomma asiaticum]
MAKKKHKRKGEVAPDVTGTASNIVENEIALSAEPNSGAVMSSPRGNGAPTSWHTSPLSPTSPPQPQPPPVDASVANLATTGVNSGPCVPYDGAPVSPLDQVLIFGHGKFQRIILVCTQLAVFCTAVHSVSTASLARPVEHWCSPPPAYANLPPEIWKNASIPPGQDGSPSACVRYEPPFEASSEDNSSHHDRETVPCDAGWDYAASTRVSIVSEWDLVCQRRWILSLLTMCYAAGAMVITPVSGVAADRLGRRPVLGAALFVLVVTGIVLAFARTLLVFAALSFFASASAASLLVISVVLLFEVTDSSRRTLYCSVAVAGGFSAASVYSQLFYYLVQDWSLSQLINMLPVALLVGAMYFVEESPCWLMATHRFNRLCKVVLSAAHMNDVDVVRVARRLDCIRRENKRSKASVTYVSSMDEAVRKMVVQASPIDMLTNPILRVETIVTFSCWFLAMGAFYALRFSIEDRTAHQALIVLELPAATANVVLMRNKGRRLSAAVSMIALGFLMGALGTISLLLPETGHDDHSWPRILEVAVQVAALLAVDLTAISLCVITVEMYPTVLRGSGISFGYTCGRFGAVAVALAGDTTESRRARGIELVVGSLLLVGFGVVALALLPETTKMQAANTCRDLVSGGGSEDEDKWLLKSPFRVARRSSSKTFRTAAPTAEQRRRRSTTASLLKFSERQAS